MSQSNTQSSNAPVTPKTSSIVVPGRWQRFRESYLVYSFKRDWMAQACLLVFIAMVLGAFLAPWIAPADPYDLASIDIMNSELPPVGILYPVSGTLISPPASETTVEGSME